MQYLQQIFGEQGARYASFVLAFLGLLIVVMLLWMLVRKALGDRINFSDRPDRRGRAPRLAVTESFSIGAQGRRLVMVRRDNVEHLLMIGGPNDVVIESNVVRGERPVVSRLGERLSELDTQALPEPASPIAVPQTKAAPRVMAPVSAAPLPLAAAPAPIEIKAEPPKIEVPKIVEAPKPVEAPVVKTRLPDPPAAPVAPAPVMPAPPVVSPPAVAAPEPPPVKAPAAPVMPVVKDVAAEVVEAAPPAGRKAGSLAERLMSGIRNKAAPQAAPPAAEKVTAKAVEERSMDALKQELEALDRMATTPPPVKLAKPEPQQVPAPAMPKVPPVVAPVKAAVSAPVAAPAPLAESEPAPKFDLPQAIKARPASDTPRPTVRNPFDSLEEEMAKLLGRSSEGKK